MLQGVAVESKMRSEVVQGDTSYLARVAVSTLIPRPLLSSARYTAKYCRTARQRGMTGRNKPVQVRKNNVSWSLLPGRASTTTMMIPHVTNNTRTLDYSCSGMQYVSECSHARHTRLM